MNGRCATILTTLGAVVLLFSTIGGAPPRYIWNASNSVPIGLYRIQPAGKLTITELAVDGIDVGEAHERDSRGRPLPVWHGCHLIADGDVFVMNWQSADSLDSRYFGPLPASSITGRAVPVWTDEE